MGLKISITIGQSFLTLFADYIGPIVTKMNLNKFLIFTKKYEDPEYPVLGPSLKVLYFFGLLQHDYRYIRYFFNFVHVSSAFFIISQFIELCIMREDYKKMLLNMSTLGLNFVAYSKTVSFQLFQSRIKKLIKSISEAEIAALHAKKDLEVKVMKEYTLYVRVVTNMYWVLVIATHIVTILTPFVKYATNSSHRKDIKDGMEPYPHILSSWSPFDERKIPGYLFSLIIHISVTTQGAGAIASYDSYAIAVMTYLKGQSIILRDKCRRIFDDETNLSKAKVFDEIKECHRHHNLLLTQYKIYNSVISPVMFVYVIFCSITMCCSIVQLNLYNISSSEKICVLEYAAALVLQLFFFCWHSNEVAVVSQQVDLGVYESKWWKANPRERKMMALLAGKLASQFVINAGPFKELSIATFIDMIKGTYSFYTLFTQMQEKPT